MQPQKPGWQTSEFAATVVTVLFSILIATGVLKPADAPELKDATSRAIEHGAALIASAATVWRYIASRTALKTPPSGN